MPKVVINRIPDAGGVHHQKAVEFPIEIYDSLFLDRPVELIEPLHVEALAGLAVQGDEYRVVGVFGQVAADGHVIGAVPRRGHQAGFHVVKYAGAVFQKLGHVFLPEHICWHGSFGFFPFLLREIRIRVAGEME